MTEAEVRATHFEGRGRPTSQGIGVPPEAGRSTGMDSALGASRRNTLTLAPKTHLGLQTSRTSRDLTSTLLGSSWSRVTTATGHTCASCHSPPGAALRHPFPHLATLPRDKRICSPQPQEPAPQPARSSRSLPPQILGAPESLRRMSWGKLCLCSLLPSRQSQAVPQTAPDVTHLSNRPSPQVPLPSPLLTGCTWVGDAGFGDPTPGSQFLRVAGDLAHNEPLPEPQFPQDTGPAAEGGEKAPQGCLEVGGQLWGVYSTAEAPVLSLPPSEPAPNPPRPPLQLRVLNANC